MKNWFKMEVATDATVADIYLYDAIGGWLEDEYAKWGYDTGTTAKTFLDELAKLPASVKSIRLHINSPGGDVFSAAAMANALREQSAKGRSVEAFVEGISASAATVVMMGADVITIADNALVMVHHPWSFAVGNAKDFRKTAEELDKLTNTIVSAYQWHSALDEAALIALMDAETYMEADEAIANGFATAKVEGLKAAALFPRQALALVPEQFRDRVKAFMELDAPAAPPVPETPKAPSAAALDVIRACAAAGCSDMAEELVSGGLTMAEATAKIATVQQARAAEASRVSEIRALCDRVKLPARAEFYIRNNVSATEVRGDLVTVTAIADQSTINSGLSPDVSATKVVSLNPADVYAARNGRKTTKE